MPGAQLPGRLSEGRGLSGCGPPGGRRVGPARRVLNCLPPNTCPSLDLRHLRVTLGLHRCHQLGLSVGPESSATGARP